MKAFYLIDQDGGGDLQRLYNLGHRECMQLMCRCRDANRLSADLEKWRDNAEHGAVFEINSGLHVICLDARLLLEDGWPSNYPQDT